MGDSRQAPSEGEGKNTETSQLNGQAEDGGTDGASQATSSDRLLRRDSSSSPEPFSWMEMDSQTFSQLALSSQESLPLDGAGDETLRRRNQHHRTTVPTVFDVFAEMRGVEGRGQPPPASHVFPSSAQSTNVPAPADPRADEQREPSSASVPPPPPPALLPLPLPSRPPAVHNRVVSWGLSHNVMCGNNGPKPALRERQTSTGSRVSSLGQPDLSDSHHDSASGGGGAHRPPTYRGPRRRPSSLRVHLDDLTDYNPIESEAETYIIRSLEQREPSMRHGLNESNPPPAIMGNVTDEAVAAMADALGDQGVSAIPAPPPDRVPPESSTDKKAAEPDRNLARPALTRGKSGATPKHRRNLTMEQKLFGLAAAIDEVHNKVLADSDTDGGPSPAGPRSRTNTLGSVLDLDEPHEPPISSVDAFQQNASILYRRIKKDDGAVGLELDDSTHTKGSTSSASKTSKVGAKDHWHKLKASVKMSPTRLHPKKSEDAIPEGDVESQSQYRPDGTTDVEIEFGSGPDNGPPAGGNRPTHSPTSSGTTNGGRNSRPSLLVDVDEWKFARDVKDFLKPWKRTIRLFLKVMFLCIILPATTVSGILFYLAGNPPTGVLINHGHPVNGTLINENGSAVDPNTASASWWLIFICVRQIITFALAMVMELIIIDFLSIHSGITFKLFGAWPTLFILQARGWPFVLFFWSVFDFALLSGSAPFFSHWLFWQRAIGLFNERNPSGHVVDSLWNHRVLTISICVAFVTAVKRFLMGFYLGKNAFRSFSDKLALTMKKILLISQVASLSRDLERDARPRAKRQRSTMVTVLTQDKLGDLFQDAEDESTCSSPKARSVRSLGYNASASEPVIDPDDRHPLTGALSSSQKTRIVQLLGAWEEPTLTSETSGPVSVNALLQFRRALTCLNTDFPFSVGFGPAATREEAIESSQDVFRRLLKGMDDDEDFLNFEVLATLGVLPDGSLDQQKLIDLVRYLMPIRDGWFFCVLSHNCGSITQIKLFRPNRDGTLSMIDFVKSTDSVYREIRLLRAAVANSSKIDAAFENIFNIFFYGIMIVIVLSQLGFDPLAMFLSISGVVLAFAFMIGSASSKYFEGLLFILVRRPYDIGDGIHVSDINADTASSGSGWWLVEDVTLFTTTVMFMFTNERATLANGSLANSRIINATRSSHACVCNYVKLPIDVPYEKLQLFNEAIEQYVHNRPREWRALCSIRAINIETAQGFVEYSIVLEHRENWRSWAALRNSQAQLATFTIELCKKLDIWYKNPPVPVNLTFASNPPTGNLTLGPIGPSSLSGAPTHVRQGSSLTNTLSPGRGGDLDYSPDLRSLQAKFAPSKDPKR